jgi:CHAT domain-containing protein
VLRTIPFAALNDGRRFLIEKYSVALSPGLELTDSRPIPQKDAKMLSAGLTEAVQGFAPLGNVKDELDGIQGLYKGERLENSSFSVENLRERLESAPYSIVHIATHGKFGPSATDTFLLAWDEKIDMNQVGQLMKESETRKTPIGLLCLSACETAAGDDKAALGLAGVAVKSGARSAMATLWSVSDQAASNLVLEFYSQLRNSGASKAEALREAQLKLLDDPQYRHPFYWSPFLLIGNWR